MKDSIKKLANFISQSETLVSTEDLKEVHHYFDHDEYEMSFEALMIELMKACKHPVDFDFDEWRELALEFNLKEETIFEPDFWIKFLKWGKID